MSACPPEAGVIGADPPEAGTVGADPPEEVGAEELLELQDARRVPANIMTKTILIYKVVRLVIGQSTSKFELIEFYLKSSNNLVAFAWFPGQVISKRNQ
jgi:hypothetical protein